MGRKERDLTGQRFGHLLVQSYSHYENKRHYWNALCDCGMYTKKREDNLLSGKVSSCGCMSNNPGGREKSEFPKEDISGKKFGRLTVLSYIWVEAENRRRLTYLCQCDCGSDLILVRSDQLKRGTTKSCGCLKHENKSGGRKPDEYPKDSLEGQHINDLEIKDPIKIKGRLHYNTICKKCGNEKAIRADHLIEGHTKSCGCLAKENQGRDPIPDREVKLITDAYKNCYRDICKDKNSDFTLVRYALIAKQRCNYCGEIDKKLDPYDNRLYEFNGMDRYNNEIGHTLENCVPCCKKCNYFKHKQSISMFLNWILRFNKYNNTQEGLELINTKNVDNDKLKHSYDYFIDLQYNSAQKDSEKNKRDFDVSKEFWKEECKKPCNYCGGYSVLTKDGKLGNGMDRVDNTKGYTEENIAPCCKNCNLAKNKYSVKEFREHMEKLLPFALKELNKNAS